MKNSKKIFLKLPEYPGGKEAFKKYIRENLIYPKEALEKQIEGIVYLNAEINDNGDVLQVIIESGVGAGCNEEAIRLINTIQFTGVKNRKVRIKTKKKFRIKFKLPPHKTINFELVNKKNKDVIPEKSKTYSYSISVSRQ